MAVSTLSPPESRPVRADPARAATDASAAPRPLLGDQRPTWEHGAVLTTVFLPLVALAAGIVLASWAGGAWGISWLDAGLAVAFYAISGLGITVGYHRLFTHGSFKAKRPLRIGLALAGSLALQSTVIRWVADHRRHHAFSDRDGDPHSPWRYGTTPGALLRGLLYAHAGWLFERDRTNPERFAPDLLADPDLVRIGRWFPALTAVSLLGPGLIALAVTGSWSAAGSALLWAGFVRVAFLHHVTWSVNSICHVFGARPYRTRDRAANVWPLAVLSFGESWHNLHHADPTSARHGVGRGEFDSSARLIALFEAFGWAYDVRWPTPERLAARRIA